MGGPVLLLFAMWKIKFSKNSCNIIFHSTHPCFTVTLSFFHEDTEYMSFPMESG